MGHVFHFFREEGVVVRNKNNQIIIGTCICFLGNTEELGRGGQVWGLKMLEERSSSRC